MSMELLALFAAAALAVQGPAPTPSETTTTSAAAPPAVAASKATVVSDDDRLICRSQRHTGSRFPVRTCRTKREWREEADLSRQSQERLRMKKNPTFTRGPG